MHNTDLQHELYVRTLDGQLAVCPKAREAKRVLDMGTGTGSWAIDYGKWLCPILLSVYQSKCANI